MWDKNTNFPVLINKWHRIIWSHSPPDWESGDDEDKSTPEEIEAEYFAAVRWRYRLLEYVPENMKTAELCLTAVQQNGMVLEYDVLSNKMLTRDNKISKINTEEKLMEFDEKEVRDVLEEAGCDEEKILEQFKTLKDLEDDFNDIQNYIFDLEAEKMNDAVDNIVNDTQAFEEFFRNEHPNYPKDKDVNEAEDCEDFFYTLADDQQYKCQMEARENISLKESDEILREATIEAADSYGLHVEIVRHFCTTSI